MASFLSNSNRTDQTAHTGSTSLFAKTHRFFTSHKRVSLEFAGAFACAGLLTTIGVTAANSGNNDQSSTDTTHQAVRLNVSQQSTDSSASGNDSGQSSQAQAGSATNHSSVNTHVTVNGKEMPVPANGVVQQTIINSDGSHTNVNISSQSSSQGNATNNNDIDYHLNVDSSTTTDVTEDSGP